MSNTVKIIIGVAVGILLLGVTCVGGFLALGFYVAGNTPEGITLEFESPDTIVVGEEFEVTVTIVNHLDQPRTLVDLDFYPAVLDGVTIIDIAPTPASDDGDYTLGMRTLTYNRPIPASGELPIVFTMIADQPSTYTGDVDISIDTILSMYSTTQTLVIENAQN